MRKKQRLTESQVVELMTEPWVGKLVEVTLTINNNSNNSRLLAIKAVREYMEEAYLIAGYSKFRTAKAVVDIWSCKLELQSN